LASAFSHALVAFAIGKTYSKTFTSTKFILLGVICSILPDADVLAFKFGIPYEHLFGHRGFTHSIFFAAILAIAVNLCFYRKIKFSSKAWWLLFLYFFLATISHAILDAMTSGGKGVAFFAPFENSRYFFPWRPIQVSPIGVSNFLSEWGLRVIKSEIIWIGIPCIVYIFLLKFAKTKKL